MLPRERRKSDSSPNLNPLHPKIIARHRGNSTESLIDHQQQPKENTSDKMDFLSFLRKEEHSPRSHSPSPASNPHLKLLADFYLLQNLFPQFPVSMLITLLLREEGCGRTVSLILHDRGWCTSSKSHYEDLKQTLSTGRNLHFTVPYFWGTSRPSPVQIRSMELGEYFTILESPNHYHVVYKAEGDTLKQHSCTLPEVSLVDRKRFQLVGKGLCRTPDVDVTSLVIIPTL